MQTSVAVSLKCLSFTHLISFSRFYTWLCIHSQLWKISPLGLRAFFSHQCFTEVYMAVLNLKECRRRNLWNPDICPYSCNPLQAPRWFQLGGILREDTETEIPSGCSLPAHCNLLGLNRFGISEEGEGNILPFFLLFWGKKSHCMPAACALMRHRIKSL